MTDREGITSSDTISLADLIARGSDRLEIVSRELGSVKQQRDIAYVGSGLSFLVGLVEGMALLLGSESASAFYARDRTVTVAIAVIGLAVFVLCVYGAMRQSLTVRFLRNDLDVAVQRLLRLASVAGQMTEHAQLGPLDRLQISMAMGQAEIVLARLATKAQLEPSPKDIPLTDVSISVNTWQDLAEPFEVAAKVDVLTVANWDHLRHWTKQFREVFGSRRPYALRVHGH